MKRLIASLTLVGWLIANPAGAQSLASCGIAVTPIPFGTYDPTSPADVTPTGTVTAGCSLILGVSLFVAYSITMSPGSGSYTARKMTGTATPLYYNLYLNGAMTQVWGDGVSNGTGAQSEFYLLGVGGNIKNYTIFAKLPARQLVSAGGYADSITVTIAY